MSYHGGVRDSIASEIERARRLAEKKAHKVRRRKATKEQFAQYREERVRLGLPANYITRKSWRGRKRSTAKVTLPTIKAMT